MLIFTIKTNIYSTSIYHKSQSLLVDSWKKKIKAAHKNAPKRVSSSTLLGAYPKTIQPFNSESTAAHCTTGRSSSSEGFSSSPGVSSVGVSSSPPGVSGSSVSPSSLLSCGPRLLKSSREAS